jgi:outer membrane protein assembly factor BamB
MTSSRLTSGWKSLLLVVPLALMTIGGQTAGASPKPRPALHPEIIHNNVAKLVVQGRAKLLSRYPGTQVVNIELSLQPPHPAAENSFLQSLQDPRSPNFHHYLTSAQWNSRFAPTSATEQAAVAWLRAEGFAITKWYANRLLVGAQAPVATVERAFQVTINRYRASGLDFYSNAQNPTIPAALSTSIQNVVGLNDAIVGHSNATMLGPHRYGTSVPRTNGAASFSNGNVHMRPRPQVQSSGRRSGDDRSGIRPYFTSGFIDPNNLYSTNAYSVGGLYAQGHCCNPFHVFNTTTNTGPRDTSIAIATACPYSTNDVTTFYRNYGMAWNIQPINVNGGPSSNNNCANSNGGGGFETTLDTEYSVAMSNSFGNYQDTSKVYIYEAPADGVNNGNPGLASSTFFALWNAIINDNNVGVMSMSWGGPEDGWSGSDMDTGHNVLNNMLGLGISPTVASGDNGAYEDTKSNSTWVQYPGSDPDVVSAGGTELHLYNDGSYNYETAWNSGGGGCSSHFIAPSYQTQSSFNNGCWINILGTTLKLRSQPDISMNASCGTGEAIYNGGKWGGVCGTSEVAPQLAGLFAQVNAYGIYQGNICGSGGVSACEPIGLPNYYIWHQGVLNDYAPHRPFYDITTGNNDNGKGTGTYAAQTGYDLATGWGSLNALQLAREILKYETWDFHGPIVSFSGAAAGHWYDYNAEVDWTVSDPKQGADPSASGVGGFSQAWDADPGDPYYETAPGAADSYRSGPEFPNATTGYLRLGDLGVQGCHYVNVRAWTNIGIGSGDQVLGPVCYDTIAPYINSITFSPGSPTNSNTVQINASAADPGCGTTGSCVRAINFWVNSATDGSNSGTWHFLGSSNGSSGSFAWDASGYADGTHLVAADPVDNAGNSVSCSPPSFTNTCAKIVLDRVAPTTSLLLNGHAPVASPYTYPLIVSLNPSDAVSGVHHSYYSLDGGAWKLYSGFFTLSSTSPSPHTIKYYSTDNAGNVEATHTTTFKVVAPPDWPQFRYGATHTGNNPSETKIGIGNANSLTPAWTYPNLGLGPVGIDTATTLVKGVAYAGASDRNIYALNSATGARIWSFTTGGTVTSSPAVSTGVLFEGSNDGKVYAVKTATGHQKWSFTTGGPVKSSPAVTRGVVYVGSSDHRLYALSMGNGHKRWSFKTGGAITSSPAVANGYVYVGSNDGKVYAIKAANGKKAWSFATGSPIQSSPSVSGATVYIGSENHKAYALKAQNGHVKWSYATGGAVDSSPAVAGNAVYVASADSNLYELNATTGTKIWSYATTSPIHSDPVIANHVVYTGSNDGKVYAVNAANGTLLWSGSVGGSASPTVDDGRVYAGHSYLWAFRLP